MELPGGLVTAGAVERQLEMGGATGHVERLLFATEPPATVAERVSLVLGEAATRVGRHPGTAATVRRLSSPDRRFLLRHLLVDLGLAAAWHTVACPACAEPFDIFVDQASLPVRPAAAGYPWADVVLSGGPGRVRVPTGDDEEAVARLAADPTGAARELARRCLSPVPPDVTDTDVTAVESALDELGPDVPTAVATACPACEAPAEVDVDPYGAVGTGDDRLTYEVHQLALAYHWPEREILALPTSRRRRYLELVDRQRGLVS